VSIEGGTEIPSGATFPTTGYEAGDFYFNTTLGVLGHHNGGTAGDDTDWDYVDLSTITGTLPIAHGGTGSTSASDARTALGVAAATHATEHHTGGADALAPADIGAAAATHAHDGTDITTGTLPIAHGGTGASSITASRILKSASDGLSVEALTGTGILKLASDVPSVAALLRSEMPTGALFTDAAISGLLQVVEDKDGNTSALGISTASISVGGFDIRHIIPGLLWTSRTSAADNQWFSVCYGNGLFVAVSNTGTGNRVMTSPDGITWTSRTSATDNNWRGVCYGNGLFVAVSYSGTGNRVMTSSDGITWTSRTSAIDNEWRGVCYGNGLFVAVSSTGTGNRVMTSPDGITWTSRTSAADNQWHSVCYENGLFVAVSYSGIGNRVMTSGK
jgi:predicted RecA/RadA family phage recombinase